MNIYGQLRYERGWEVTELAEKAGVSRQTIMRLESGATPRPTAAVAKALADAFGVTVQTLLGIEREAA